MEFMTPQCAVDGCNEAAAGYRQPVAADPKLDPWHPACGLCIFRAYDGEDDWRIAMITQRKPELRLSG